MLITRSRNEKAELAEREIESQRQGHRAGGGIEQSLEVVERERRKATALAKDLSASLKVVERERRKALNSLSDICKERGLNLLNHGDGGRGLLWVSLAMEYAAARRSTATGCLTRLLGAWRFGTPSSASIVLAPRIAVSWPSALTPSPSSRQR